MKRYASNGEPWWLLLMRAYKARHNEGRLGLAYLAFAEALLFGGSPEPRRCLQEISDNTEWGIIVYLCASSKKLLFGFDETRFAKTPD